MNVEIIFSKFRVVHVPGQSIFFFFFLHFHPCQNSLGCGQSPLPSLALCKHWSVSVNLHFLDISYHWNHGVCSLFYMTNFTFHDVSEILPCCNMNHSVVAFYLWMIFHYMHIHLFLSIPQMIDICFVCNFYYHRVMFLWTFKFIWIHVSISFE